MRSFVVVQSTEAVTGITDRRRLFVRWRCRAWYGDGRKIVYSDKEEFYKLCVCYAVVVYDSRYEHEQKVTPIKWRGKYAWIHISVFISYEHISLCTYSRGARIFQKSGIHFKILRRRQKATALIWQMCHCPLLPSPWPRLSWCFALWPLSVCLSICLSARLCCRAKATACQNITLRIASVSRRNALIQHHVINVWSLDFLFLRMFWPDLL
jgi:hypothetical protein